MADQVNVNGPDRGTDTVVEKDSSMALVWIIVLIVLIGLVYYGVVLSRKGKLSPSSSDTTINVDNTQPSTTTPSTTTDTTNTTSPITPATPTTPGASSTSGSSTTTKTTTTTPY